MQESSNTKLHRLQHKRLTPNTLLFPSERESPIRQAPAIDLAHK
jgi:hypothetical protein